MTDNRISRGDIRTIYEHGTIVLTKDLPDESLRAGDIGTVIHIHKDNAAFETEFMTPTGETLAIVTLLPAQLRPIARNDVAHVRELTTA